MKNYNSLAHVLTSSSLTVYCGAEFIEVGRDHANFNKIAKKLEDPNTTFEEIQGLGSIVESIRSSTGGKIEVTDLGVFYNGELIHNSVVEAIFDYKAAGMPLEPIIKFLENLMQNSSKRSIDQLWNFVNLHKLPLTEDGCLLAYKTVKSNYLDKHSGTIDNNVGQVIKMDRNKISDDPNHACHAGLHVGGLAYSGPNGSFSGAGDRVIIVKFNPKDVVCVPNDCSYGKMRVCEYEVVKDYCEILRPAVYNCDYNAYEACECDEDECEYEDEFEPTVGEMVEFSVVYNEYGVFKIVVGEVLTDRDEDDNVVVREVVTRALHEVNYYELDKHIPF